MYFQLVESQALSTPQGQPDVFNLHRLTIAVLHCHDTVLDADHVRGVKALAELLVVRYRDVGVHVCSHLKPMTGKGCTIIQYQGVETTSLSTRGVNLMGESTCTALPRAARRPSPGARP